MHSSRLLGHPRFSGSLPTELPSLIASPLQLQQTVYTHKGTQAHTTMALSPATKTTVSSATTAAAVAPACHCCAKCADGQSGGGRRRSRPAAVRWSATQGPAAVSTLERSSWTGRASSRASAAVVLAAHTSSLVVLALVATARVLLQLLVLLLPETAQLKGSG